MEDTPVIEGLLKVCQADTCDEFIIASIELDLHATFVEEACDQWPVISKTPRLTKADDAGCGNFLLLPMVLQAGLGRSLRDFSTQYVN